MPYARFDNMPGFLRSCHKKAREHAKSTAVSVKSVGHLPYTVTVSRVIEPLCPALLQKTTAHVH